MSKWQIKMAGDTATIYVYEQIGEWWGLSAKDFATQLADIGDVKTINLRINSLGGSVFDGFTIHSLLRDHPAKVIVHIDGIAASIASVIAMAGDEIKIAENGFIMVHEPWTIMQGTAKDFRNEADLLDKLQEQAINAYVKRSGLDRDEVFEMLDGKETWLNAAEAVEKGFATEVAEPSNESALVIDREMYPNAPKQLRHQPASAAVKSQIEHAEQERNAVAVAVRLRILDIENAIA